MASGGGGILQAILLRFRVFLCALTLLAVGFSTSAFCAFASAAQIGLQDLTVESVQRMRDAVEQRRDLTDSARQELLKSYDAALDWLKQAESLRQEAARFERDREAAPSELEVARAESPPAADSSADAPADATIDQLRQLRDQAEARLVQSQRRVATLEEEQAKRTARRAEVPPQTARAQEDLDEALQELQAMDAAPRAGEFDDARTARRIELRSRIAWLEQFLAAATAEIASFDARVELNQFLRERAARRLTAAESAAKTWRDRVSRREQEIAAGEASAARQAAAVAHPTVRRIADQNVQLLEQLSGTPDGKPGLLSRQADARAELEAINRRTERMRSTLEREVRTARMSGLSDVIDMRLRKLHQELPSVDELEAQLAATRLEFAVTLQQLANVEYERDQLPDGILDRQSIIGGLDPTLPLEMRDEIVRELERELQRQRSLYDSLINEYTAYGDWLLRLQDAQVNLIQITERLKGFIDERILWIRSMPAIGPPDWQGAARDASTLFASSAWRGLGSALWIDAQDNIGIVAWWTVLLLAVFVLRTFLGRRLRALGDRVRSVYDDRFSYTMSALMITTVLAAFWPAVLWFIMWRLNSAAGDSEIAAAHTAGLKRAAVVLLVLQFYRHLCKSRGLGDAHFGWRESIRRPLARHLTWFIMVACPLAYVIATTDAYSKQPGSDPLGRVAFIVAMVAMTVFASRVLRPGIGVLDNVLNRARNGWAWQTRYVWYGAAVGLPLALAVLAGMGYFYSALQLERRVVTTLWLILVLIVFAGLVLRWLVIVRRSLALEQAKQRRTVTSPEPGAITGSADVPAVMEQPKFDINAISAQTRRLLRGAIVFSLIIGVWVIWIDLMPALGVLNRVQLWPTLRVISSEAELDQTSAGSASAAPMLPVVQATTQPAALPTPASIAQSVGESPVTDPSVDETSDQPLTLLNLLTSLAVLIAVFAIARNIPGLMEITVLQWFTMEPSARYATATIVRYIIVIIGLGLAFHFVGIGWSKVQWLAAAITLGIGFGLQEIFANFISGLILLFEQPIRVGDTVTVNGVDGTVTRIRMRATTIIDFDRKELVIPNKSFITSQIVNWTLSDPITRMVFPVGVAYGTDVALVERTLQSVAKASPLVVDDPAPQVVFTGFGDSTLNFSLRVFLPNLENLLRARHEINSAIDAAFRAAGIEIAFPQRDIHIRSTPSRPS